MPLTQEEIDGCRDAFLAFDKDRSGTIDVWELRLVLETMGQKPTDEELFQMISEVDDNMSGSIGALRDRGRVPRECRLRWRGPRAAESASEPLASATRYRSNARCRDYARIHFS
jgi:hypothetical protein